MKRRLMASIKKRTRTARRKDTRTGQIREVEVEYWRARYRDDGGKEHVRHFDRRVDGLEVPGSCGLCAD
jgi:hypothetical protein